MSANNTFLRLSLASVLIGSMLGMPAVVCASSPAQTTSEVQQNTNVSSEIVKLWVQRNKQRRELAGIKDQLNKTQAGLDELKQLINEVRLKNPDDDRAISEALAAINDLEKQIQKVSKASNSDVAELKNELAALASTISKLEASVNSNSAELQKALTSGQDGNHHNLYILFFLILAAVISALAFVFNKRITNIGMNAEKLKNQLDELNKKQAEFIQKDAEQLASMVSALAELQKSLESQCEASLAKISSSVSVPAEPDHSLIKVIADRLAFMQVTLFRMDSSVRGHRQLSRSLKQINDNLLAYGYEIVNLLGQTYTEGMKLSANFIEDEDLKPGERIITGISKPQINYNGRMIQSAQVTVSQNI